MKTSQKIIQYITQNESASAKDITDHLNSISSRAVRKQLKKLYENNILHKIGKPPKVFYILASPTYQNKIISHELSLKYPEIEYNKTVSQNSIALINKEYLYITPAGEKKEGWNGFVAWCQKTKQPVAKTARDYIKTLEKYDSFKKNQLIDGKKKFQKTFHTTFLDELFYLDFYSIERFGKTKLGQLLLYAKQSQNKHLIQELVNIIHPRILALVKKYHIDGILFVPPSVKREIQFMKELEKQLHLPQKKVHITKIKTTITIPQKTLSKLEDRIENAKKTMIIEDKGFYKNILIIDDAVGSGATMHEIAAQIRRKNICQGKIIGLAITGSFKGFDVISEV